MIIKPPKQRIQWEANRIIKEAIENNLLLDRHKGLKPEEIIGIFEPQLLEYLSSIYSYDNHCSIKIYKILDNEQQKILEKIKENEEFTLLKEYPKIFDETEIELNERYLSKIDEISNYHRFWYISFKQGKYSFGFSQEKSYIVTVKENIFLYQNFLILRGQINNLPNLRDSFVADFRINKTKLLDLTNINLLNLFDKLKEIENCEIKTSEITKENPISSIPAHRITFSGPLNNDDIEEFDDDDETAQMINEAENLAKSYNYCFTDDSGYKECATISINKKQHIRILKKISDITIFNLVEEIERAYNEM